jgi:hypothetical protein
MIDCEYSDESFELKSSINVGDPCYRKDGTDLFSKLKIVPKIFIRSKSILMNQISF